MAPLGPFGPAPHLLAGVSGGPHSLALALLLGRWAAARGGRVTPVIVDHGLRPESAAEAAGVAGMLAARGFAPRILALRLEGGAGLQARARAGRLGALLGLAAALGAPWLALGQHRGDQAETLLLRGLAGSGQAGLAGMAAARAAPAALLIRPLLGLAPARLEASLAAAGLTPVRDPSNADRRFARVRLRQALADPGGTGPGVAALARAAAHFAARRAVGEAAVAARLADSAALHPEGFARLDLAALGRDAVAVAALGALIRLLGGGFYPPSADSVAALLARGEGTLAGAALGADGLLAREVAALGAAVPAEPGQVWDGRWRVVVGVPGGLVGALGAQARRLRPAWMPARVAAGLPALHSATAPGKTALAAVPALGYPEGSSASGLRLVFAPSGGALF
jgi:tRNA(Ile)-lysidine synthase